MRLTRVASLEKHAAAATGAFPREVSKQRPELFFEETCALHAAKSVTFAVKNTGKRAGVEIAQVYATTPATDEPFKRLVGWQRVELAPGEMKTVTVALDPRVMSVFSEQTNAWSLPSGAYKIAAGPSSAETPLTGTMQVQ